MPETTPLTDFERRLSDALASHADVARDPRPTQAVATEAMRGRQRRRWTASWPRHRLLGLAAVLLLPLALAVAGARVLQEDAAGRAVAITGRASDGGLDVVVVDVDGRERLLRRITGESLGLGPDRLLQPGGSVSADGWLVVYIDASRTPAVQTPDYRLSRIAFVNLADPERPPIVLPSNGFVGVRWGPAGEAALVCGTSPDCGPDPGEGAGSDVRVLDLGRGSETIVRDVKLYGGNPEQVWAADGSGFLAGDTGAWGVTPIAGGPVVAGTPRILSHSFRMERMGGREQLTDADTIGRQWLGDGLAPAVPVWGRNASDGMGIWMLLGDTQGETHTAILARLTGPGVIASVQRIEVPSPVVGLALSDDDAWAALQLDVEEPWSYVLAAVTSGPTVTSPPFEGLLLGLVPAIAADAWPSD